MRSSGPDLRVIGLDSGTAAAERTARTADDRCSQHMRRVCPSQRWARDREIAIDGVEAGSGGLGHEVVMAIVNFTAAGAMTS
jgi:hypothetical protein